jgi:hypothetical protein
VVKKLTAGENKNNYLKEQLTISCVALGEKTMDFEIN